MGTSNLPPEMCTGMPLGANAVIVTKMQIQKKRKLAKTEFMALVVGCDVDVEALC